MTATAATAATGDTKLERVARALDCTPLRLTLFLWLIVAAIAPIFQSPRLGGWTLDWLFFQMFDEIARQTILEHGQLPIWNPYFCGGTTMIGNPQTTYLTPTFPLVLLFGTTFGERLSQIPVLLLGCEGGWRLLRHLGTGRAAALLAAVALAFFGRTFAWLNNGQHGLVGFVLTPWVFYGYIRGLSRPVYLALGAAFFAWMVCFRGIETSPEVALGLGLWGVLEARRQFLVHRTARAALWPIAAGGILGLLALGYAGLRMFPVLELVLKHPRVINETRSFNLSQAFVEMYALPAGLRGFDSPGYVYVGPATFVLFVGAVLFARARARAAMALVCALFFNLLTMGMQGYFSPLFWLHKLPLLRSLRNPALWSVMGAFFVVLGGAFALDELLKWLRTSGRAGERLAAGLAAAVLLFTVGDMAFFRGQRYLTVPAFPFTWETPPRVKQEFHQSRGNYFEFPLWPYVDRGTLSCYDETPFPASPALRPDLAQEEYLAEPDAGSVKRITWSPNRIELAVSLTRPATLLVNQNYQSGWSSSVGTVYSRDGLVAVDLPAGEHRLRLRMWPPLCTVGLLAMALALLVTAWLWRRDARRAP